MLLLYPSLFWSRWIAMYVLWLQIRHRWHKVQPKINVGDLVLLLKSQTKGRKDYQKASVIETYHDARGSVRSLKIKMSNERTFTRDVRNVAHLEGFKIES